MFVGDAYRTNAGEMGSRGPAVLPFAGDPGICFGFYVTAICEAAAISEEFLGRSSRSFVLPQLFRHERPAHSRQSLGIFAPFGLPSPVHASHPPAARKSPLLPTVMSLKAVASG